MKKLEILYSFMKEFYKFVSGYTACGKGYGHCCRNLVNISDIEIDYIVKHTKKKRLKHYLPKQDSHGMPCPFLVNESCSTYEFRPYECRRHGAYTKTNHWCHPDRSNSEIIPNLRFDDIDNAFNRLRYESGPFEGYDIRQVFGRSKMKGSQNRVVLFDKKISE
jgi:Fe-S-cluster containining protein